MYFQLIRINLPIIYNKTVSPLKIRIVGILLYFFPIILETSEFEFLLETQDIRLFLFEIIGKMNAGLFEMYLSCLSLFDEANSTKILW